MKIKTGQIWSDTKNRGRSIKVVRTQDDSAICIPITDVGGEPAVSNEQILVPFKDFEDYELVHDPAKSEKQKKSTSDINARLEKWFSQNPIKKWLIKTGTSYPQLSALVGVSTNSIHSWLTGRSPSDENFPIIAAAIGMSESEFKQTWRDWQSRRPTP